MKLLAAPAVLGLVLLCLALRPGEGVVTRPRGKARQVERLPEPEMAVCAPASPGPVNLVVRADPDEEADGATEDACFPALRLLLREQNADGSWGDAPVSFEGHLLGRVGLTAFGLSAFLASGYSHLSKDCYDGFTVGEAVKSASRYLRERMGPDGRFDGALDPALEQALGAYALSEHYGLTGSSYLEAPAQRSLDALWALQTSDGSWGTRSQTDWAAFAFYSAKSSDLWDDPNGVERLHGHYARREAWGPDPGAALFRLTVLREKAESLETTASWIAAKPVTADPDQFGRLYFHAWTLRRIDGTGSPRWRAWNDAYKAAMRSTETAPGLWTGGTRGHTVLRNSLAMLSATLYYRSSNVYGPK